MTALSFTIDIEKRNGLNQWNKVGELTHLNSGTGFEMVSNGGGGNGSVMVQQLFNQDGFIFLADTDEKRLVYKIDGVKRYYGYLRKPIKVYSPLQQATIEVMGPVDQTNRTYVKKTYVPPSGSQDLSWFYFQLAKDYILKRGYADRISIEDLGINVKSVEFKGTLRECLTDLGTLGNSLIYWWFEITSDGFVTFMVRKRDLESPASYSLTTGVINYSETDDKYDPAVVEFEYTTEDDRVNTLFIHGGASKWPNRAVNPSFEDVRQGPSASQNMCPNGSFDDEDNTDWELDGADIKHEEEDLPFTGRNYLELDVLGDTTKNRFPGFVGTRTYGIDMYVGLENPNFPNGFTLRVNWYDGSSTTIIKTDIFYVTAIARPWTERIFKVQCPVGASEMELVLTQEDFADREHEQGILVDEVIVYDDSLTYQFGWRVESSQDPNGDEDMADPRNLYLINWTYNYSAGNNISPGPEYGAYGIQLDAFGKTEDTYVRIINPVEGEFEVTKRQYYSFGLMARATAQNGDPPPPGVNMRMGVIWIDKDDEVISNSWKEFALTQNFVFCGHQVQAPKGAVKGRMFFEALQSYIYYFDGVYFGEAPDPSVAFTEDGNMFFVISVKDVYAADDPRYTLNELPPVGNGPVEESIDNSAVLTRADARRLAKAIFDQRCGIQHSGQVQVSQVDSPIVYFTPNSYLQMISEGYTLEKLWMIRTDWRWDNSGWKNTIELEKESPHVEDLILGDRNLAIIAVGVDAIVPNVAIPSYQIIHVITDPDPQVTDGNTLQITQTDTFTLEESLEAAIGGFEIPKSWITMQPNENGSPIILTIVRGDGRDLETDDRIDIFGQDLRDKRFITKIFYASGTLTGTEVFHIGEELKEGSIRAFIGGFRRSHENIDILLDVDGVPSDVSIPDMEPGLNVCIAYIPLNGPQGDYFNYEGVLDSSGSVDLPFIPYQWEDGSYSVRSWIGGLNQFNPVVTIVGGVAKLAVPTDRVGDSLIVQGMRS